MSKEPEPLALRMYSTRSKCDELYFRVAKQLEALAMPFTNDIAIFAKNKADLLLPSYAFYGLVEQARMACNQINDPKQRNVCLLDVESTEEEAHQKLRETGF